MLGSVVHVGFLFCGGPSALRVLPISQLLFGQQITARPSLVQSTVGDFL
jgi:hypothetical protein